MGNEVSGCMAQCCGFKFSSTEEISGLEGIVVPPAPAQVLIKNPIVECVAQPPKSFVLPKASSLELGVSLRSLSGAPTIPSHKDVYDSDDSIDYEEHEHDDNSVEIVEFDASKLKLPPPAVGAE
jgi:hypothetical protein